ncbi:MAG TPA: hypothetical protein VK465_14090 [Fibrobacteria bacterium]|nr:hypothetical protein [Fibrobacteria bacterium]
METVNLKSILVFSAILSLGIGKGAASLQLPADRSFPDATVSDPGKAEDQVREDMKRDVPAPAEPAGDEKTDCDDCVIVDAGDENAGDAFQEASAGSGGLNGALAGTLWGLFAVSRPKRLPRTIIRGVTVP